MEGYEKGKTYHKYRKRCRESRHKEQDKERKQKDKESKARQRGKIREEN
jgi:hypothetical protein